MVDMYEAGYKIGFTEGELSLLKSLKKTNMISKVNYDIMIAVINK